MKSDGDFVTTATGAGAEVGFNGLIGLFEQTQTAMQTRAARSVDTALVVRNWLFGRYIVEFENGGAERAELYGKALIKNLSEQLTASIGRGFSKRSLEQYRKFYLGHKEIAQTASAQSLQLETPSGISDLNSETVSLNLGKIPKFPLSLDKLWQALSSKFSLSWSHYVVLMTIKSTDARKFYEIESRENMWGVRELKRQFNSGLYERLALSRNKEKVKELSAKGQLVSSPSDVLKSPCILEFLDLKEESDYSEHELETAIIDKIELFLLELGKGFLFESRQKRFSFDNRHFFVDLVFYNRLLRSYVVIDLKIGELKHQDLGQMQMYVNYFDRHVKTEDENPTVGILLCLEKNDELVELTLPKDANIYASEYQLYLPSKEELKKQLEEAQREWNLNRRDSLYS